MYGPKASAGPLRFCGSAMHGNTGEPGVGIMRAKRILIVVLTLVVAWCGLYVEPAFAAYSLPYFIDVDLTNQIVTIYNTSDGSIARQMLCSTGTVGHETPIGVYYLPAKDRSDERS